jgi:prepilin-type N-terminal cleavage/methylation domain-containing protein
MDHSREESGFTLVELMIVVAIIGVLASVAIPSFINYQMTAKRSEAFSNLSALSKAQKAYYSEFNTFVSVAEEPSTTLGTLPNSKKRDSTSIGAAFAVVGWKPDGDVFYDYDSHTPGDGAPGLCTCLPGTCFTASAYGDIDANGLWAVISYAQPDVSGQACSPGIVGALPIRLNEPIRDTLAGRF